MAVYLLHSDVPLLRSDGTPVFHYVGWAPDGEVYRRLQDHLRGRNRSVLVQQFLERGATLWLGNHWWGKDREYERRLKLMGHLSRRCYRCKEVRLREEWNEALAEGELLSPSGGEHLTRLVVSGQPSSTGTVPSMSGGK